MVPNAQILGPDLDFVVIRSDEPTQWLKRRVFKPRFVCNHVPHFGHERFRFGFVHRN